MHFRTSIASGKVIVVCAAVCIVSPGAAVAQAFTDINAALPAFTRSSAALGDYDNDADLGLAIAGLDTSSPAHRRANEQRWVMSDG